MKKIFLICFILLFICGCGSSVRNVGNTNQFENSVIKNELIVEDNMHNYTANYIKEAILGTKDDITIEMVVYDNLDNATQVQNSQIDTFMKMKSTGSAIKKEKGNNYYKFTMVSNGYYLVSSRIENTLIFTQTLLKNKDKVDSILNEMGY